MKKNQTRRALLMSALSLLLCMSMLVGSTFAWFTDSVTSGRNTIVAGNLDVVLEYWDGDSYEEVTSTTKLFDDEALWEPGYTEVAYLKVSNAGSLALKYQLAVSVYNEILGKTKTGADIKLSDYLQFKVVESDTDLAGTYGSRETAQAAPATATKLQTYSSDVKPLDPKDGANDEDYVALIIYMPTTVGNEANHDGVNVPKIEMGVNLFATQLVQENDSFGPDYDEDAWHPDFVVTNSDELKVALTNGGNVALANDVIISESLPVTKDTVLDLNGKNIGTSGSTTGSPLYLQGGKLTVKNGTLDLDGSHTNVNGTFSTAIGYDAQTELVVENVNFTGTTAINGTFATDGPLKIAISDCTMDVTNVGIAVSANSTEAIATINNCNIDADVYAIFASQGSKITINGGTYKSAGKVITSMYDNTVVTINGGTFDGELWVTGGGSLVIYGGTFTADPSAYVATGYQAVNNGDGTWTVKAL
jgi:predicted ribosomally synthesized peptide with SipW-like signal peptide